MFQTGLREISEGLSLMLGKGFPEKEDYDMWAKAWDTREAAAEGDTCRLWCSNITIWLDAGL